MTTPQWRLGEPNAPGLWIVQDVSGVFYAWIVTWDRDEPAGEEYLRFDDLSHDTSEPVATYPWPPVRSFGPIKKPGHPTKSMKKRYVKENERRLDQEANQ